VIDGWDVLVVVGIDAKGIWTAKGEREFDFEGVETPPDEGHGGCGRRRGVGSGGSGDWDACRNAGSVVAGC